MVTDRVIWVTINGRKFDNLVNVAKFAAKNDAVVQDGSHVKHKQEAASVIKNVRTYIATIHEPQTKAEWLDLVNWCLRAG